MSSGLSLPYLPGHRPRLLGAAEGPGAVALLGRELEAPAGHEVGRVGRVAAVELARLGAPVRGGRAQQVAGQEREAERQRPEGRKKDSVKKKASKKQKRSHSKGKRVTLTDAFHSAAHCDWQSETGVLWNSVSPIK